MDFLNQAIGQVRELFLSMTPAAGYGSAAGRSHWGEPRIPRSAAQRPVQMNTCSMVIFFLRQMSTESS